MRHMNFSLKFNCLNDNLKTGMEDNELLKTVTNSILYVGRNLKIL